MAEAREDGEGSGHACSSPETISGSCHNPEAADTAAATEAMAGGAPALQRRFTCGGDFQKRRVRVSTRRLVNEAEESRFGLTAERASVLPALTRFAVVGRALRLPFWNGASDSSIALLPQRAGAITIGGTMRDG